MRDRFLVIGVPSRDMVHTDFAMSLVYVFHTAGCRVSMVNSKSSVLPVQRNEIVREAIRLKATHLLFVDSDMRLPLDTAARLLAHGKDVVGAAYVRRVPPHDLLGAT